MVVESYSFRSTSVVSCITEVGCVLDLVVHCKGVAIENGIVPVGCDLGGCPNVFWLAIGQAVVAGVVDMLHFTWGARNLDSLVVLVDCVALALLHATCLEYFRFNLNRNSLWRDSCLSEPSLIEHTSSLVFSFTCDFLTGILSIQLGNPEKE